MAVIAPSILSADFARLGDEVKQAEAGGAGLIHVDVMDGQFVPNITIGPLVVRALRKVTSLPLDCHLMIVGPDRFLEDFVAAGATSISVHVEAVPHLHRTVARIRELGARPGVVINPGTPLGALEEILPDVDYVLVMSVNPGFGGQRFIKAALDRIRRLKGEIDARGLRTIIEVDGGVGLSNARALTAAGAEWLVAGSAVFDGGKPTQAVEELTRVANSVEV